jgi:hypothetical protein
MSVKGQAVFAGFLVLAAWIGVSADASAQGATLQNAPSQLTPSSDSSDPQADPWPREQTEAAAKGAVTGDDAELAYQEIDWGQLNVDIDTLMTTRPAVRPGGAPIKDPPTGPTWTSTEKPNGSSLSVKQTVSPLWDARVGADMTVVRPPATIAELLAAKAGNGGNEPQSSGTAWAAATAPGLGSIWDKTSVEARFDPSQDQGKLGTALTKSLSFGQQYSLTLQNGYGVVQGLAPVPGLAGRPAHNYEAQQSAKFNITDTGTSLSAGQSLSTAEDKWLRRIGAEQKIFGGFNISASVAETALGPANKSISAGFKQSW